MWKKATNNYSLLKFKAESKVTPRFLACVWTFEERGPRMLVKPLMETQDENLSFNWGKVSVVQAFKKVKTIYLPTTSKAVELLTKTAPTSTAP